MILSSNSGPRNGVKGKLYRWGPVLGCMILIFYMSSKPDLPDVPYLEGFLWDDKLLHVVAYAVLGALIWRALSRTSPKWWQIGATVALATAYGLSDESHQYYVPGREFDMWDLAADALGSAIAAVALTLRIGGDYSGKETQR